jgi:hypothetical protein
MSNCLFGGVNIGDFGWLEVSHENEVEVHKIPRADGAILRRRGGGLKTLTVHGWVKKTSRKSLEEYINSLAGAFGSGLADLVVNGNTYSNCILKSISPGSDYYTWSRFSIVFYKSGD